jgi:hypothetical protein
MEEERHRLLLPALKGERWRSRSDPFGLFLFYLAGAFLNQA